MTIVFGIISTIVAISMLFTGHYIGGLVWTTLALFFSFMGVKMGSGGSDLPIIFR